MYEEVLTELLSIRKGFLEVVSSASESYTLKEKLEILVAISRTGDGRANLASKNHLNNQQVDYFHEYNQQVLYHLYIKLSNAILW